ncbi:MAG: ABC transporter permease [Eubacterium sp.]|nr:ABC transporter permease [Eubacterium sp.]
MGNIQDGFTADDFQFAKREVAQVDHVFSGDSYFRTVVKKFTAKKSNIFGLILLALLIVLSIIGPYLTGHPYDEQNLDRANMAPRIPLILDGSQTLNGTEGEIKVNRYEELGLEDTYYIFGTDELGRDLFSRCFQGLRISLLIALISTLINLAIGMNYGMISGYIGGKTDLVMQSVVDVASSIPALVVVTLMMLVLEPGFTAIIIAMMVTGWMEMSIVARMQVMRIKDLEYIQASRTLGAGKRFILFHEVMPNIIGPLMTQIMVSIPNAIYMETFLSFIGLGMPVGSCSIGTLISSGFSHCLMYPYQLIPAIVVLVLLMVACNLVADGLREAVE